MNVEIRDITFNVRIVGVQELNEYARADLYRSFIGFMEEKGLKYKFLVAETELITKGNQNERT